MTLTSFKTFFKKYLPILFLVISITGCSFANANDANDSFRKFTLSMFKQEVSSTTINLHYTLQSPDKYGIFDTPVTFGSFSTDSVAAMASLENCQAVLQQFPREALNKENQLTYDILNEYLTTAKKGAKYMLYEEPLSPVTGLQAQLPVLLAEYQFHTSKDIDTYLALMKTMPEYFHSLIDFQIEKSEKGLFLSREIADSVLKQCHSFVSTGKENYLYSTFEERLSTLDFLSSKEKKLYIVQNKQALETYLFPAYKDLIEAISKLRENSTASSGICNLPDGKSYYEYVVARDTGSSRDIAGIKELIQKQMGSDATDISKLLASSATSTSGQTSSNLTLGDNSPAAFLKDLENKIPSAFPNPPKVTTTIKYVPKPMEPHLSPAFYLIPSIDNTSENVIYINRAHTMESLNLYTTLAHEGYPGHLYQTTYFAQKNTEPLRSLLNFGGYVEGWATYAEMCSYSLSPLTKPQAALAQKNGSLTLGLYASADIGIHYDNWSLTDTISYFTNYGIKNPKTITEIYNLIVSSPGNYLKYYVGYLEFLELKKEVSLKQGKDFSQKEFHKAVLDVGPAPFSIVRKYVMEYFS